MRRIHLGIAAGAVAIGGLVVAWRLLVPARLGLERPRVVLSAGDATVDGGRARPAQPLAAGAALRTGHGNLCFSVHASRVCLGANTEAVVTNLGEASATIGATRGTVIAASTGDELRIELPAGSGAVVVRVATVAVEDVGGTGPTVRALEGNVTVQSSGRADQLVAAPQVVGQRDGQKRASVQSLEAEERSVVEFARSWQGTAGGILQIDGVHGRIEVDGAEVGLAPAGILLAEGTHTLVLRENGREISRETLRVSAGQKVVRGGDRLAFAYFNQDVKFMLPR